MAIRNRTTMQQAFVTGQDQVIRNLQREIAGIKGRTRKGMREAALEVRAESMRRTPVETGNLKNEHYTEVFESSGEIVAEVGTGGTESGSYAVYVHEDLDAKHTVGEARFLATALVVTAKKNLEIIRKAARVH